MDLMYIVCAALILFKGSLAVSSPCVAFQVAQETLPAAETWTDLRGDLHSRLALPGCSPHYMTAVFSERDQPYFRRCNTICSCETATAFPQSNMVIGENVVTAIQELCEGALASWLHLHKVLCSLEVSAVTPHSLRCLWSCISTPMCCHRL